MNMKTKIWKIKNVTNLVWIPSKIDSKLLGSIKDERKNIWNILTSSMSKTRQLVNKSWIKTILFSIPLLALLTSCSDVPRLPYETKTDAISTFSGCTLYVTTSLCKSDWSCTNENNKYLAYPVYSTVCEKDKETSLDIKTSTTHEDCKMVWKVRKCEQIPDTSTTTFK